MSGIILSTTKRRTQTDAWFEVRNNGAKYLKECLQETQNKHKNEFEECDSRESKGS